MVKIGNLVGNNFDNKIFTNDQEILLMAVYEMVED